MKPQSMTQHLVRLISLLILSLPGSSFLARQPVFTGTGASRVSLGSELSAGAAYDVASLSKVLFEPPKALAIAELCDAEDRLLAAEDKKHGGGGAAGGGAGGGLALWLTRLVRRISLERLLQADRAAYLETVAFLGERLPRTELPNRQDVPLAAMAAAGVASRPRSKPSSLC